MAASPGSTTKVLHPAPRGVSQQFTNDMFYLQGSMGDSHGATPKISRIPVVIRKPWGNQGPGVSQFSETPVVTPGKMLFGTVQQARSCLGEFVFGHGFLFTISTLIHVSNCQGFQVSNGEKDCVTRRTGSRSK